ncbi:MAG: Flp pilus assembly protein CpaB [Candidatus Hinthialibacter antarcticus]|nr:Flp pilus assembly protein CpaB [Candidatus Hinthialibacter antarcticus]
MSKLGALLILVVAVFSGLFASATVLRYIKQQQTVVNAEPEAAQVVVAVEKISAGSLIRAEKLKMSAMLNESVPLGVFGSIEEIAGRYARTTIYPGEMIVADRLADANSFGGLPALIPEGMRAITLRVDDTISVAGFVRPGHRVDVLSTFDVDEGNRDTVTKTILQNLEVIATGQELDDVDDAVKRAKLVPTVTVLVSLAQAEQLTLASNAGVIRLVLRNTTDQFQELTEGTFLTSMISREKPEVPLPEPVQVEVEPAPQVPMKVVEVFRGIDKSEVNF